MCFLDVRAYHCPYCRDEGLLDVAYVEHGERDDYRGDLNLDGATCISLQREIQRREKESSGSDPKPNYYYPYDLAQRRELARRWLQCATTRGTGSSHIRVVDMQQQQRDESEQRRASSYECAFHREVHAAQKQNRAPDPSVLPNPPLFPSYDDSRSSDGRSGIVGLLQSGDIRRWAAARGAQRVTLGRHLGPASLRARRQRWARVAQQYVDPTDARAHDTVRKYLEDLDELIKKADAAAAAKRARDEAKGGGSGDYRRGDSAEYTSGQRPISQASYQDHKHHDHCHVRGSSLPPVRRTRSDPQRQQPDLRRPPRRTTTEPQVDGNAASRSSSRRRRVRWADEDRAHRHSAPSATSSPRQPSPKRSEEGTLPSPSSRSQSRPQSHGGDWSDRPRPKSYPASRGPRLPHSPPHPPLAHRGWPSTAAREESDKRRDQSYGASSTTTRRQPSASASAPAGTQPRLRRESSPKRRQVVVEEREIEERRIEYRHVPGRRRERTRKGERRGSVGEFFADLLGRIIC